MQRLILPRRSFLTGLVSLIAAPAVVRAESLMPICVWKPTIDPDLLWEAQHNPVLDYMIKHGIPLERQTWLDLNWGSEVPKPWTAEDEDQVPRAFRLDEDSE